MPEYYYGGIGDEHSYDNVLSVMAAHDSLHSQRTSSLPLAQFWGPKNLNKRLKGIDLLKTMGVVEGRKYFEFPMPPRGGKGKASMTDLMIFTKTHRIAVEAKYTEYEKGDYETVAQWNKTEDKNKEQVLIGWLKYMGMSQRDAQRMRDVPYQLVHRIASAYGGEKELKPVVVYQLFYDNNTSCEMRQEFVELLQLGLNVLRPTGLTFAVVETFIDNVPPDMGERNVDYYLRMNMSGKVREVFGAMEQSLVRVFNGKRFVASRASS